MPKIGLVGLGVIGRIYAANLTRAFGPIYVYDSARERMAAVEKLGALASESGADLASSSEVVLLALPNPEAVRAAVDGKDGLLEGARPGTVIVDLSTIDPKTAIDMHARAKELGVDYLDSPISGGQPGGAGTDGAKAANVTFMVSGDRGCVREGKACDGSSRREVLLSGGGGDGNEGESC